MMSYHIYAWLEKGIPHLQIKDSESKSTYLSWSYQTTESNYDKQEIQRLFRELILLTCKQKMDNYRIFEAKPAIASELLSLNKH